MEKIDTSQATWITSLVFGLVFLAILITICIYAVETQKDVDSIEKGLYSEDTETTTDETANEMDIKFVKAADARQDTNETDINDEPAADAGQNANEIDINDEPADIGQNADETDAADATGTALFAKSKRRFSGMLNGLFKRPARYSTEIYGGKPVKYQESSMQTPYNVSSYTTKVKHRYPPVEETGYDDDNRMVDESRQTSNDAEGYALSDVPDDLFKQFSAVTGNSLEKATHLYPTTSYVNERDINGNIIGSLETLKHIRDTGTQIPGSRLASSVDGWQGRRVGKGMITADSSRSLASIQDQQIPKLREDIQRRVKSILTGENHDNTSLPITGIPDFI